MYNVNLDKEAKKFLKKLKKGDQEKILTKIKKLSENPYLGKRLSGDLFGLWRLRIDKFRALYKIIENKLIIVIIDIGHRKNIYG